MPPKCKTASPPTGGKLVKKQNQVDKDSILPLTEDKVTVEPQSGKIVLENQNEEKGFCTFATRYSTSNPMDKEIVIRETVFPNQALNQDLRTKVAEKEPVTIPKQDIPSDPLDKKNVIKEAEVSNLALNQYLKEKTKHNLQASLRWKVFLFLLFPSLHL